MRRWQAGWLAFGLVVGLTINGAQAGGGLDSFGPAQGQAGGGLSAVSTTGDALIGDGTAGSPLAVLASLENFAGTATVDATGNVTLPAYLRVGTATDAAAAGDFSAGLTGGNRIFYDQSTNDLRLYSSNGASYFSILYNHNNGYTTFGGTNSGGIGIGGSITRTSAATTNGPVLMSNSGNGFRLIDVSGETGSWAFHSGSANGFAGTRGRQAKSDLTLSGATTTASNLIPAGCILLGVTVRVTTAVTSGDGGTSWDLGDGTDADRFGDDEAFTLGTTTDLSNHTAAHAVQFFSSASDVVVTCNGGTFSGGVLRIVAHYLDLSAAEQ